MPYVKEGERLGRHTRTSELLAKHMTEPYALMRLVEGQLRRPSYLRGNSAMSKSPLQVQIRAILPKRVGKELSSKICDQFDVDPQAFARAKMRDATSEALKKWNAEEEP